MLPKLPKMAFRCGLVRRNGGILRGLGGRATSRFIDMGCRLLGTITWRRKGGRWTSGQPLAALAGDAGGYPAPTWALGAPETRYAKSEDGYIAYQVFGHGPHDILFIGNWASNIEVMWAHPSMARYLNRLGRFARVICFDKRGAGLSDPVAMGALPTLAHWMDDARIVLDAAGPNSQP
jgi:hypothetical protein